MILMILLVVTVREWTKAFVSCCWLLQPGSHRPETLGTAALKCSLWDRPEKRSSYRLDIKCSVQYKYVNVMFYEVLFSNTIIWIHVSIASAFSAPYYTYCKLEINVYFIFTHLCPSFNATGARNTRNREPPQWTEGLTIMYVLVWFWQVLQLQSYKRFII